MTRSITNRKRFASAYSCQRMRIGMQHVHNLYPSHASSINMLLDVHAETKKDVLCDIISWAIRMNDEKVAAKLANPSKKRGPG